MNENYIGQRDENASDVSYEKIMEWISLIAPAKGNINGKISHLRDTFLDAEKDYLVTLLGKNGVQNLISDLNQMYEPHVLYSMAQSLMDKFEFGEIQEDELKKTEIMIISLLAVIQDVVLEKDLVLYPDWEQDDSRGGRCR